MCREIGDGIPLDSAGQRRFRRALDRVGAVLDTVPQRRAFATHAVGLMSDGERKSAVTSSRTGSPQDHETCSGTRASVVVRSQEAEQRDGVLAPQPAGDGSAVDTAHSGG